MTGEIIELANNKDARTRKIRTRLQSAALILHAIDAGELLAAIPECPLAADTHKTALKLLAILESELNSLCNELDSGIA
jgi:hypothetical protein